MSSGKWRQFCLGLNVLMRWILSSEFKKLQFQILQRHNAIMIFLKKKKFHRHSSQAQNEYTHISIFDIINKLVIYKIMT